MQSCEAVGSWRGWSSVWDWVDSTTAWAAEPWELVDQYNVVWDSPSEDSTGSMPLGNGEIALNAWVEPNGDLVFYIGDDRRMGRQWTPAQGGTRARVARPGADRSGEVSPDAAAARCDDGSRVGRGE